MSSKSQTDSSPLTEVEATQPHNRKRPLLKRILSVLGWGLFVVALVAIWPTALGGKTSYIVVSGHSMEPTLQPGDFVVLRSGEYEVGDVVSYLPFDDIPAQVIHRIIDTNEDGTLVLQGDNNNFIDPYSPAVEDVVGEMLFSVPKIGKVGWFIGHPLVWGSMLLIAAALLIYEQSPPKEAPATRSEKKPNKD